MKIAMSEIMRSENEREVRVEWTEALEMEEQKFDKRTGSIKGGRSGIFRGEVIAIL